MVIASFTKNKPFLSTFKVWVANLNHKIGDGKILFNYYIGKKKFMLKTNGPKTIKNTKMLTSYKSTEAMCIFQSWISSFNLDNPKYMIIPIWVTLRKLLADYQSVEWKIVTCLGNLLGMDKKISTL